MVKKLFFLWALNFFLAFALAVASQSQYYSDLGNITSDLASYSCWPSGCIAYVNLTINSTGTYFGNLSNLSLNNTAEASGITYKIDWYNGSTWVNQSENNTWVNGPGNNFNLTATIHEFRINITLPNALSTKWNVSFNVEGTDYVLNPYLDSINLTSPANYNITTVQTPSFNFTLYSHNSTTQTCTLYMRINDAGSWTSYGSNSSTINGTLKMITASSLSEGNYTWKITCNTSGDSGSQWIYIDDNTAPTVSDPSESASSSTVTITWTTSEAANSTINYGKTYSLGNRSYDGSFTTSHSMELSDLSYSTTYYYNVTNCDQYGNCKTSGTHSFATSADTDSTTTSSSTPPTSSKSKTWTTISSGATGTWILNDKNLGIKQINVTVSNLSTNAKLTVSKYSALPSQVSVAKSGKIYRYLRIEATNLNQKLNLANILLQVEKSWVQNNSLTKQDISLYKFDNSSEEWKKITTSLESEDATYYYFGAELTSFSYFTIVGEVTSLTTQNSTAPSSTTSVSNASTNASAGQEPGQTDAGKKSSKLWIVILIVIIGIVALAVVGFIIYTQIIRKQKLSGRR